MNLLSWQNITLRKRSWELNICNKFPIGVILRSKKNNMCSGKGEKDETENEKMFWFKFEDRVSGEGLKELGEKEWELGSSGLKRLDPMAWKELNPEGRSWIKWLYEFSSLVSLWWSSSWCLGWRHSTAAAWLLLALAASDLVPAGGRCR